MLFHPLCYFNCALCRLENDPKLSRFFLCDKDYWLEDTKRNTLEISDY